MAWWVLLEVQAVISRQQRALLDRAGGVSSLALAMVLGCLSALTAPLIFLLCGMVVDILAVPDQRASNRFGTFLPNLRQYLPADLSPLGEVSVVLAIALALLLVQVICLYLFYRRIQQVAVRFEANVMQSMWEHSRKLAVARTLSGQQTALIDGLEYHLPRVRASLSRWWRAWPRHCVQLVACFVLALLIAPVLAILTVVAAAIVVLVYRTLDRHRRTKLPVIRERATQRRAQVMALCLKGPLLESVHSEGDIQGSFTEELTNYRKEAVRSLASSAWKTPLIVALVGILACLFVFIVAVQVLRPDHDLTLAGCLAFVLSCVGVAISGIRLQRSGRELRGVQTASEDLVRFLSLPADSLPVLNAKRVQRITQRVELEHVTVQDSSGRKLLENVTASFKPGVLVGLVASQRLQASALMELLLGIGRPVSGRMLVDNISASDLEADGLKRLGIWISDSGPLVTGTINDNLLGEGKQQNSADVTDALRTAKVLEAVQRLPEGVATVITPNDDRFLPDTPFRLGIARALLRKPSIMVIEEPNARVDAKTEQETIEAIRSVVSSGCITVLLPQRLTTLRQCDQVLLLHEHQVAQTGTHAELLQQSDLYRHLNYVRFSPLRHVTV